MTTVMIPQCSWVLSPLLWEPAWCPACMFCELDGSSAEREEDGRWASTELFTFYPPSSSNAPLHICLSEVWWGGQALTGPNGGIFVAGPSGRSPIQEVMAEVGLTLTSARVVDLVSDPSNPISDRDWVISWP